MKIKVAHYQSETRREIRLHLTLHILELIFRHFIRLLDRTRQAIDNVPRSFWPHLIRSRSRPLTLDVKT